MKRFIQNTAYQYVNYIWMILIGLFLPPLIIHYIGLREFGVWALLTAIIRYFELLDLGTETTLIKHVSEFHSKKETEAAATLASTALVVQSAIFLGTIALAAFLITFLSQKKILSGAAEEYTYALFIAIVSGALKNIFLVYRGVLAGLQRMKVSNTIEVLSTIPYIVSVVLLLRSNAGINELITSYLCMVCLSGTVMLLTVNRFFSEIHISFFRADKNALKSLFRFGSKLQVSRLSQLASFHLDKLFIAIFLNVTYVGVYDLGAKIVTIMRNFPLIMVSAVTPAVSEMKARGEQAEVKEFYTHGSLCLISAGLPFLLFSAVFADQLIHAWIGRQIPDAALAVRILSLGYFLNLSTGMACGTAIGMGRPDIEMRAGILTTIMNPLLSIVGLTFFGYKGALVATSFSLSAGAIYLLYLFRGVLSETLQSYFRLFFLPTLCAAMALLFIKSAEHIFFSVELPTPFEIRIFVPAAALTYGILYYLILSKTGHLTSTWKTFFRLKAKI